METERESRKVGDLRVEVGAFLLLLRLEIPLTMSRTNSYLDTLSRRRSCVDTISHSFNPACVAMKTRREARNVAALYSSVPLTVAAYLDGGGARRRTGRGDRVIRYS